MAYPISAFLARLQECNGSITRGSYTPATLGQLAQNLSRLVFALPGGVLLVSEGEQPRAWAEVALREVMVPVRRVGLPAAPAQGRGFALIGLGAELGFVLAATPTDTASLDQTTQLYDTRWSLDPSAVGALAMLASDALPGGLAARLHGLRLPAMHELLQLSAATLDFTARQHATLVVTARALNDRLRHHEDQTRMIVHDMRAPLHTLLICLRTLQRQRFDPEGQHELLAVASESAAYLLTLTETVLDSARMETSSWSLKRQPVQVRTLVQAVCEPLELAARPDQARISRQVAEGLPLVWLDQGLMERVMTNLLTNAIKYTPANGEIRVSARLHPDGDALELSVSDSGQGIPPEAQARIFERFYQASETDRPRGTGLGLYFCRLAVEAHGGSIAVRSSVGQGSTFTILLPLTSEGEEQASSHSV